MKNEIRLALLCLAATAVPALAQNVSPACETTNFDRTRGIFSIVNPATGTMNQQCFLTVFAAGTPSDQLQQYPRPHLVEGNYAIELAGGGGGGAGGAAKDQGGGGGGTGAAPMRSVQYLSRGVYKVTIGTGGEGGGANSDRQAKWGYPTSLTNINTGQLIAGFQGAETWTAPVQMSLLGTGKGGVHPSGGSDGGSGGDSGPASEEAAQPGGLPRIGGNTGTPGPAGVERGRSGQANAGGGGGASVGSGGAGGSPDASVAGGAGDLGSGGGGGAGGSNTAGPGGRGGHGFVKLAFQTPAPVAQAPVIIAREPAVAIAPAPEPVRTLPMRRDRN